MRTRRRRITSLGALAFAALASCAPGHPDATAACRSDALSGVLDTYGAERSGLQACVEVADGDKPHLREMSDFAIATDFLGAGYALGHATNGLIAGPASAYLAIGTAAADRYLRRQRPPGSDAAARLAFLLFRANTGD